MAATSGAAGAASAPAGTEMTREVAATAKTELGYEVRWDEGQRLFRVWNPVSNAWISVPGFSEERIAKVVAEGLSSPPQARRGSAEAKKGR